MCGKWCGEDKHGDNILLKQIWKKKEMQSGASLLDHVNHRKDKEKSIPLLIRFDTDPTLRKLKRCDAMMCWAPGRCLHDFTVNI